MTGFDLREFEHEPAGQEEAVRLLVAVAAAHLRGESEFSEERGGSVAGESALTSVGQARPTAPGRSRGYVPIAAERLVARSDVDRFDAGQFPQAAPMLGVRDLQTSSKSRTGGVG